jgi:hypothetical protein
VEEATSKSRTASIAVAVGAISALTAASSHAAELKVSGTAVHVIVSSDSQKLSDGRTLLHVHDKAIIEASDPKSPLHLDWRDCFGTLIMDAKGDFVDGAGFCETFDKSNNDGYWSTWSFAPEGARWNSYHGAGKFEGVSGSGTAKFIANFPDRYIVTFEGTLTMK